MFLAKEKCNGGGCCDEPYDNADFDAFFHNASP
jgi:hypothetical protein